MVFAAANPGVNPGQLVAIDVKLRSPTAPPSGSASDHATPDSPITSGPKNPRGSGYLPCHKLMEDTGAGRRWIACVVSRSGSKMLWKKSDPGPSCWIRRGAWCGGRPLPRACSHATSAGYGGRSANCLARSRGGLRHAFRRTRPTSSPPSRACSICIKTTRTHGCPCGSPRRRPSQVRAIC